MLPTSEIVIRLLLASLFGALIGLERERKDWTAGMRTHMMVCVGSSLIMMVSAFGFSDILGTENVTLDPSRVAAQVVSGIGFIGAGTIMFLRPGTIRGLTTAAGLWTVAAIGLATGGGMYFAAGAATLVALIILWALQPLENIFAQKFKQKTLRIVTHSGENCIEVLKVFEESKGVVIQNFFMNKEEEDYIIQIRFDSIDSSVLKENINSLQKDIPIKEIIWNK
ncbi:MAG: MgtC/SapB family protein [Bacteroidetes bacterium]|nr:MgtC/SapB family protein [Bacteroidota bacterium]